MIKDCVPAEVMDQPGTADAAAGSAETPAPSGWRGFELKLALRPADVAGLLQHPMLAGAPVRPEILSSVCFDTPERKLRKAGSTLRIRRVGDRHIQTIGTFPADAIAPSGFGRVEWEHEVDLVQPDRSRFSGTPLQGMIAEDMAPVFETRIERRVCRVGNGGCGVEVRIDQGELASGERRLPICEIEIESKGGDRRSVFDIALSLSQALPLLLALESKEKRGYDLADGRETASGTACPIPLPAPLTVRTALQAIGHECLRQLAANVPALLDGSDDEALHQIRVAIRRFRAAMSLFKDILQDPESDQVKVELQKMAALLGDARDLEVFAEELARVIADNPDERSLGELRAHLDARKDEAYRRARYAVSSATFHGTLIRAAQWLAVGSWTSEDGLRRGALAQPVVGLAAAEMTRRRKAVKRAAHDFDECDPAALHKLRVQVKKLRYASEFFASLFQHGKRKKAFLSSLIDIQAALGGLNDLAVQHRILLALARIADRPGNIGDHAGFAAGFVRGQQVRRIGQLRKTAKAACTRFLAVHPFWREHRGP
ncbi:MAG: CHAD domain-containing protein [Parvibaculaceae bacterium]